MKLPLLSLIAAGAVLLLSGCRQERIAVFTCPLPPGMSPESARALLVPLDDLTPPEVTCEDGMLTIRYNALHLSPGNFTYTLTHPQPPTGN